MWGRILLLSLISCALASFVSATNSSVNTSDYYKDYTGFKLIRVQIDDNEDVARLQKLVVDLELEPWTEIHANHSADVFVPPAAIGMMERVLKNENFTVVIADMQRQIDKERMEHDATQDFNFLSDDEDMDSSFHARFHRYGEIEDFLRLKAEKNPNLATFNECIGYSVDGKKIFVFKITSPSQEGSQQKPIILINSLFHAREWISGATALYMIDRLLDLSDEDSRVKDLINRFEWHFIPVANPDGYEISWTRDRLWRANKNNVDNNRNFAASWKHFCSLKASDGCSGSKAFSEPETQAIADYIYGMKDRIKGFFDLHAYSELWMYPFGSSSDPSPFDSQLRIISEKATDAIYSVHGIKFRSGPIYRTIYKVTGDGIDWAHSVAKIPYPFAIECRPAYKNEGGFIISPTHIAESGEEIMAGILAAAEEISKMI